MPLSADELAIRQKLKDDFTHYASRCLRIRTKSGAVEVFELNKAQAYIHDRLEEQKAETGKVRALVLKGRQQGCSTLIGGRFYHRVTHARGCQVFILTHEQSATDNLFAMANRYHDHCPALVKPSTGAANAKELAFPLLDSGYQVGTAGTKAVGRSKTIQLFHGSEVAFWPHAASHFASVIQAIPDLPGTEIILESTANGVGGEFHERWQQAEAGIGDYQAIFVPWFWQDEYQRSAEGFEPDDEEQEYAALHGLTPGQMAWRRAKVAELKDPLLFKQEYPATAAEAFQTTGHDSFIKAEAVLRARKTTCEGIGPLVIGADPAHKGGDRFAVAWRRGRKVEKIEGRTGLGTVEGANWLRTIIEADKPAKVFIDVGGMPGVYDLLVSWGFGDIVTPVNFGSSPMDPVEVLPDGTKRPGAKNRRAEMWSRSRDWLDEEGGADIPDKDSLQADACGPGYSHDTNQRLLLESKEAMRSRGVRSPDEWDAVVLTFAEPVFDKQKRQQRARPHYSGPGGFMG